MTPTGLLQRTPGNKTRPTRHRKARKAKERDLSRKEKERGRDLDPLPRDPSNRGNLVHKTDRLPKPRTDAKSASASSDYLFATIERHLKPMWRKQQWEGDEYMVCTVADPQKKIPVFKTGKVAP